MINIHLILTPALFTEHFMRRDFKKDKRGRGRETVGGAVPEGEERGKSQAFHMEPFATEFWPNISYILSLRTRGAKRYHLWFPVSTKELLILLKLAHKSLHPQGCSFLSPTPPHLCRRYYDTSPPCFLSYPRPTAPSLPPRFMLECAHTCIHADPSSPLSRS